MRNLALMTFKNNQIFLCIILGNDFSIKQKGSDGLCSSGCQRGTRSPAACVISHAEAELWHRLAGGVFFLNQFCCLVCCYGLSVTDKSWSKCFLFPPVFFKANTHLLCSYQTDCSHTWIQGLARHVSQQ